MDKSKPQGHRKSNILMMLEKFSALIPTPLYWEDRDSVILGANNHVLQGAGITSLDQYVGKTLYELYPKEMADHIKQHNEEVMRTGKTLSQEESIKDISSGKIKYFTAVKSPLYDDDGSIIGIIGTSIDITERKETQEKLIKAQITAEKEQEMRKTIMMLVGDIVHDLKTPIAMINGSLHILNEVAPQLKEAIKDAQELKSTNLKLLDDPQVDYVLNKMTAIQKKSVHMINDFIKATLHELSVAQKYQDGTIAREDLNKCSIRRVLENAMEGYPKNEKIIINQCFPYDFIFMGNSILMLKVLFNLIKNAEDQIIANDKGEITITTKESGDKNILIIKDTAGGASPEIVENLFKDFFTTKKDGTGIGLAFCKKIMHNFGGDITCHSNFGESIEFILSFPKMANSNTSANTTAN